jgi:hypothetical protein
MLGTAATTTVIRRAKKEEGSKKSSFQPVTEFSVHPAAEAKAAVPATAIQARRKRRRPRGATFHTESPGQRSWRARLSVTIRTPFFRIITNSPAIIRTARSSELVKIKNRKPEWPRSTGQTGTDAAALACNLDIDLGEMKHEPSRSTGTPPNRRAWRRFRGTLMKQIDDLVENKIGDGNGQQKKGERKSGVPEGPPAEEKRKTGDPKQNKSEDVNRVLVNGAPLAPRDESEKSKCHAGDQEQGSHYGIGTKHLENAIPFQEQDPCADEGNEDKMRRIVVGQRVGNESADRMEEEQASRR